MSQAPGIHELDVDPSDDPDRFGAPPPREALQAPNINHNRDLIIGNQPAIQQYRSPAIPKVGESRIPGPAGRPPTVSPPFHTNQLHSGVSIGGDSGDEFTSPAWAAALRFLGLPIFDEAHPAFHGSTVRAAQSLQQSGRLPRLVFWVVSLQVSHTGECLIKLKDPSGAMTGTLTADVLPAVPHLTKNSVVLLEDVAVLLTPQPHASHHLCIALANIAHVVPRQPCAAENVAEGSGQQQQQQLASRAQPSHGINLREGDDRPLDLGNSELIGLVTVRNPNVVSSDQPGALAAQHQQEQHPSIQPPPPGDAVDDLMDGLDDDFVS